MCACLCLSVCLSCLSVSLSICLSVLLLFSSPLVYIALFCFNKRLSQAFDSIILFRSNHYKYMTAIAAHNPHCHNIQSSSLNTSIGVSALASKGGIMRAWLDIHCSFKDAEHEHMPSNQPLKLQTTSQLSSLSNSV